MAARLAPDAIGAKHQSLHHFVAKTSWQDATLLTAVRAFVLPKMEAPIQAWIIGDTGVPKKGKHSVGLRDNTAESSASRTIAKWP